MKSEKHNILFGISLITQIGITVMVPIFICLAGSIYLSNKFGKDYIVLLGVLFGIVVAFRNVYVLTKKMYFKDYQKEKEKQKYFDDLKRRD